MKKLILLIIFFGFTSTGFCQLKSRSFEEVDSFIEEYVVKIKTELYFINEYEILILKLNEISHWIFGNSFPLDYYKENKDALSYFC